MTLISIILLFAAIANFCLLGYVFGRRHSRPVHFAFARMVFFIGMWILCTFLVSVVNEVRVLVHVGRLTYGFSSLVAYSFLVFSWWFPERSHPNPGRRARVIVTALASIMFVMALSPLVQSDVRLVSGGKHPVFGRLHLLFEFYIVSTFLTGFWNLFRSRLRTPSGRERMQLNYALTGFVFSFLVSCFSVFLLPFLTQRSDLYLLGATSTLVWTTLTFYAVFRHRLMDIGVAIRNVLIRGMVAAVLTLAITAPFFLDSLVGNRLGLGPEIVLVLGLGVLLAVFLPNLQQRITRFVDQQLFRGRYDHETAMVRFADRLLGTYGHEDIAHVIARELPIILQARGCAVYLAGKEPNAYRLCGRQGMEGQEMPQQLHAAGPLAQVVHEHHGAVLKDEVGYAPYPTGADTDKVLADFEALDAVLVFPLSSKGGLLGLIFLGEKKSDNTYTSDDLDLLGALGAQAAIALENTRLYSQILEAQKHYEITLRHMQRGVLTVDNSLQVVTLNETGAAMLGLDAASWLGEPLPDLLPRFAGLLRTTLERQHNLSAQEVTVAVAERAFPCECETSLLLDADNHPTGALLVFQDLTERKHFEAEVRRIDRLASVGTLAAGLAHEIKNPLVSVQTFVQLLPERFEDPSFRDSFGTVVAGEVARIDRLVRNLLDFARPRPSNVGTVDVREVLEKALTLLANQLQKAGIELIRDYAKDSQKVHGDDEQLHQVSLNLLQNAIESMSGSVRRLTIQTAPAELFEDGGSRVPAVQFLVQDTGVGVEKDELPRIFDPFYSTKTDGSGLGLAICHSIVKEHGGKVDVNSSPGQGTTFSVTLPVKSRRFPHVGDGLEREG